MKFLVLATCIAASSASGFFGLQTHPNGAVTPIDEPAVAAARADHLATKFGAYGAGYGYAAAAHVAAPVVAPVAAPLAHPVAYGYAGPLHLPTLVAHPNGAVTPADEPAVVAARADHLAAHGVVGGVYASAPYHHAAGYAAAAPVVAAGHVVAPVAAPLAHPVAYGYAGPLHVPTLVAHPNGAVTPADE